VNLAGSSWFCSALRVPSSNSVQFLRARDCKMSLYVLPLGEQSAWVALEARSEDIAQYRASFEASLASVGGLHEARDSDPRSNAAWLGSILMAMGAGAGLRKIFARSSKAKRRRRPSAS